MYVSRIAKILFSTALAALMVTAAQEPANALCLAPKEEGNWVNVDPNTNSLVRVRVKFVCQDTPVDGQPCCPMGPPYYIRIWGACSPAACDWGQIGAQRLGSGDIYGFYDQGFAKRYVWVSMSPDNPSQLWVTVSTDFADPNRPDYDTHAYFNRN